MYQCCEWYRYEGPLQYLLTLLPPSPLCSLLILLAGFGVYLLGIKCLWLHTCVRVHTRMHRGSSFHQRRRILKSSELHKGIQPKVRYLFFLRL